MISIIKFIVIFRGSLIMKMFSCGIVCVIMLSVKLIKNRLVIIGVDIWKVIMNMVLKFFVIKSLKWLFLNDGNVWLSGIYWKL